MLQMLFPLLLALVTLVIMMPEDVQYIFIRWHICERSANQIFRYLVYTSTCTRNYRYVGTKNTIWNDQVKQGLENTLTHLFQSKILLSKKSHLVILFRMNAASSMTTGFAKKSVPSVFNSMLLFFFSSFQQCSEINFPVFKRTTGTNTLPRPALRSQVSNELR